jgi:hypothetical protein
MKSMTSRRHVLLELSRRNIRLARRMGVKKEILEQLHELTVTFGFSLLLGDLTLLDRGWYVTHSGLLGLSNRRNCSSLVVRPEKELCDSAAHRWVFRATLYKSPGSKGFVGYGDADPSNVSSLVRGAEMRVAETRAVNRALRKAYGIGICSVEELGLLPGSAKSSGNDHWHNDSSHALNGSNNGQPRLRDRLCLLIRQYNLDPTLVKAYAADFCGTQTLSGAGRDLVESFISHLAAAAKENRGGLICKLNSYGQPQEVKR